MAGSASSWEEAISWSKPPAPGESLIWNNVVYVSPCSNKHVTTPRRPSYRSRLESRSPPSPPATLRWVESFLYETDTSTTQCIDPPRCEPNSAVYVQSPTIDVQCKAGETRHIHLPLHVLLLRYIPCFSFPPTASYPSSDRASWWSSWSRNNLHVQTFPIEAASHAVPDTSPTALQWSIPAYLSDTT